MLSKVKKKWSQGGISYLCRELWRVLLYKVEKKSPIFAQRIVIQLYWLPLLKLLKTDGNHYYLYDIPTGNRLYFENIEDHSRFWKKNYLRAKKVYYDKVELGKKDVVVDIGAYIGVTSMCVSEDVAKVFAIEASPRNFEILKKNTENKSGITPINCAVWNEDSTTKLKMGGHASDDSLIDPDGKPDEGIEVDVPARTLDTILNEWEVNQVDFMKVEVEGVEPEVIEGLNHASVDKLAVNCDPERDQASPVAEVRKLLEEKGYSVQEGKDVHYSILYAKK